MGRTFRWCKGQKHYSGTYWSATAGDHVIYESRLELGRLLFADFHPGVRHIVARPFLIKAEVQGELRRHIPDYPLLTDGAPVVVAVCGQGVGARRDQANGGVAAPKEQRAVERYTRHPQPS